MGGSTFKDLNDSIAWFSMKGGDNLFKWVVNIISVLNIAKDPFTDYTADMQIYDAAFKTNFWT